MDSIPSSVVLDSLTIGMVEDIQPASSADESGVACAVICVAVLGTVCVLGCVFEN